MQPLGTAHLVHCQQIVLDHLKTSFRMQQKEIYQALMNWIPTYFTHRQSKGSVIASYFLSQTLFKTNVHACVCEG